MVGAVYAMLRVRERVYFGAGFRDDKLSARFDLTPTYRNVNNKFSVKYYLNLVLVDEEDRRYFKQQEITLWRKEI